MYSSNRLGFVVLITKMDSHGSMYVLCWTTVGYPHAKQTRNNLEQFQQPEICRVTSSKTTICDETGSGSQGTKLQAVPRFCGFNMVHPPVIPCHSIYTARSGFIPFKQASNSKSKMPNPIRDASAVETPLAHLVGSAHDQTAGAARHSYIMLYIVSPHEIRMASFYLVKSQIWIFQLGESLANSPFWLVNNSHFFWSKSQCFLVPNGHRKLEVQGATPNVLIRFVGRVHLIERQTLRTAATSRDHDPFLEKRAEKSWRLKQQTWGFHQELGVQH